MLYLLKAKTLKLTVGEMATTALDIETDDWVNYVHGRRHSSVSESLLECPPFKTHTTWDFYHL